MKKEDQTRSLLGISLADRPTWQQFLICSSEFFFGYLVNGVCEEYVYNRISFRIGIFLVMMLLQLWMAFYLCTRLCIFGADIQGFTTKQMVNQWKTYVKLSAVLVGSHGLTKGSLAYLNYPGQNMFRSTKCGNGSFCHCGRMR